MTNHRRISFAMGYAFQFGPPGYKGCGHLARILKRYAESDFSADAVDYRQLIAAVAEERSIQPESLKQSVRRYIEAGWKRGFSDAWKCFTGWESNVPTDVNVAVQLLCRTVDAYIDRHDKQ